MSERVDRMSLDQRIRARRALCQQKLRERSEVYGYTGRTGSDETMASLEGQIYAYGDVLGMLEFTDE